jgi:tRNA-Thr(GGU) m(6)t(6)A37 methyltransferase TsaA
VKLEPIGVVHSMFTSQTGTPVQPSFASIDDTGTVEVYEPYAEGLEGLEGFDRIWLICWFDRSGPPRMKVVPYLDTQPRGLFSTRSPSRPNPIGISAVRLLRREGRFLHVAELDILDGTPLLDIKPYSAHIDVFPEGAEGWLSQRTRKRVEADDRFSEGS